jgi:DNA helicase HerA-like ATPase
MNTNTPSSTLICGVQGSGKSHSVSVIIENSLIALSELGKLPSPLSVVVFHLGAGGLHLPCESAFIRKVIGRNWLKKIPVKVVVSPSNLQNMNKTYAVTGADVVPFYLSTKDLNCTHMLSLMRILESGKIPLYMEVIQQILRSIGNDAFDYQAFKKAVEEKKNSEFIKDQKMPLDLRIQLLKAVLLECQDGDTKNLTSVKQYFRQGTITVVDLTDPFISASAAGALFDIVLSLYLEIEIPSGKLLVLDEAHKVMAWTFSDSDRQYLTTQTSALFVESIFSIIRQQRHLGIRTVISTQEPTVVPADMLGLCSTIICHRFSSPLWWKHLKRLIALDDDPTNIDWFDEIAGLTTGEGIVFCPLALDVRCSDSETEIKVIQRFERGCFIVKIWNKLTPVTGQSVLLKNN